MRLTLFSLAVTIALALTAPCDTRNFELVSNPRVGTSAAIVGTPTAYASESATAQDCSPNVVPGKHGTPNIYRVPFNGDGRGNGVSRSILVTFKMFDDGRIKVNLKYENDSKESFCGGVHIRLGDINNNSIAEFYSDPNVCLNGKGLLYIGGVLERRIDLDFQTTSDVACKYAHLYIVPNRDHPAT